MSHSLARWQPWRQWATFLVQLTDAKGSNRDFILKELWLCVFTCLVVIWWTVSRFCLSFTHLRTFSGQTSFWDERGLSKAFKGKYIIHSHLGQGITSGSGTRLMEKSNKEEAGERDTWGSNSSKKLLHIPANLQRHPYALGWTHAQKRHEKVISFHIWLTFNPHAIRK